MYSVFAKANYEWRSNSRAKSSLQKSIHSCGNNYIISRNVRVPFISCKLGVLGASSGPGDNLLTGDMCSDLCHVIRKSPPQVSTYFLKMVINSWYTSHRLGEVPLLPCFFGCEDKEDNLKHYLTCESLWTLAVSASGLSPSFLSPSPLDRLCIANKPVSGLQLPSVAFRGYHALKLGQRGLIDSCSASSDFDEILFLFVRVCRECWSYH